MANHNPPKLEMLEEDDEFEEFDDGALYFIAFPFQIITVIYRLGG
jgi:hypothetical protein